MAGIELQLDAHRYHVPCAEDEQARLEQVAALVEDGARALAESGAVDPAPEGENPDRRFLALLSLLLADQLFAAQEALRSLSPAAPEAEAEEPETISQELSDALTELLDSASQRMESLAERFEKA